MIEREADLLIGSRCLRRSRVVALLGPRQCGKTTLARQFVAPDSLNYFDLEDPQARLSEPNLALRPLKKLVVIDEIQRRPDLFPILRVLADRTPLPARFLILGSASTDLLRQSSETLAGRLETVPLEGFRLSDLGAAAQNHHWLRGGFPRVTRHAGSLIRWPGAGIFSRLFSNAIFLNWAARFQRLPCDGSGTWWRTIMGRSGTQPNWPALWR